MCSTAFVHGIGCMHTDNMLLCVPYTRANMPAESLATSVCLNECIFCHSFVNMEIFLDVYCCGSAMWKNSLAQERQITECKEMFGKTRLCSFNCLLLSVFTALLIKHTCSRVL